MNKKGLLHDLVHSLSKSEKRYLRIYAGIHKEANYQRLFDFIEAQPVCNDQEIKEHFKGEKFTKQLHVAKIYLYDLIMKCLRNYHAQASVYNKALHLFNDLAILFEKELYDACYSKLDKLEDLVEEYELDYLRPEALLWRRRLGFTQPSGNNLSAGVNNAELQSIERLKEINYLWHQTSGVYRRYTDKHYLKNLEVKKPVSLRAKTLLHHVNYSFYFMNGKTKKAEQVIAGLIKEMEQHPHIIREDPAPYMTAISNKIGLLIGQKRWKEIDALLHQMKNVSLKYGLKQENKFTTRLWLRIYNLELEVCRDAKLFSRFTPLVREIEAYLFPREKQAPEEYRLMIYYQVSCIYFLKRDFSKALEWSNKILNSGFNDARNDLQCYSRILNLAIHSELNNILLLRYAVESARRFFKKKKFKDAFAEITLRLFSRLSLANKHDYRKIFGHARQELALLAPNILAQHLDYFNLQEWILQKLKA